MDVPTIRKARESDAESIARILRDTGWFERFDSECLEESLKGVRVQIALCMADDSHSVYVAESQEGDVVGYASAHWLPYFLLQSSEGFLSELFVENGHRERGVGGALLNAVVREARERGCSRLMLVNNRNRDSYRRKFYQNQGWAEREEIANFVYKL